MGRMYQLRDESMRFHHSLEGLFADPSHLRVLRALWKHSPRRLTGRAVASQAGVSVAQTARVLIDLQDVGIVASESVGRAIAWSWNPDHAWARSVARLFEQESEFPTQLAEELTAMLRDLPIERASLFGSVAKGRERSDSDIDLFVEAPNRAAAESVRTHLARARADLWRKYGSPLAPLVLTSDQARRRPGANFVKTIEAEGIPLGV
ncbi:MAG: nucleotidyltransferase domain-containing protein [Thermoplasmata archaeon]|nr:nucleotidyltransferase domain-containing protein [Thermoplasmata archaeon]